MPWLLLAILGVGYYFFKRPTVPMQTLPVPIPPVQQPPPLQPPLLQTPPVTPQPPPVMQPTIPGTVPIPGRPFVQPSRQLILLPDPLPPGFIAVDTSVGSVAVNPGDEIIVRLLPSVLSHEESINYYLSQYGLRFSQTAVYPTGNFVVGTLSLLPGQTWRTGQVIRRELTPQGEITIVAYKRQPLRLQAPHAISDLPGFRIPRG